MPALFQYAIFFLAALLCISLVLCVRDTTDPLAKDAPARPPADDKAPSAAQPAIAPLQRIGPRVLPDRPRPGEPLLPHGIPPAAAGLAPLPSLGRIVAPDLVIFPPLPHGVAPLVSEPLGSDSAAAPLARVALPAAGEPSTPPTLSRSFEADPGSRAIDRPFGAPSASAAPAQPDAAFREPIPALSEPAAPARPDTAFREPVLPGPEAARAEPALLGFATMRTAPSAPVPATPESVTAIVQRIGPRTDAGEASRSGDPLAEHRAGRSGDQLAGHLAPHSGDPLAEHLATQARHERDRALDQRNDTLWDLVVHLRDYVEQLRAERYALREEARQLRVALSEATEEVRALRAAQGAANSNELTKEPAEAPSSEPARLGAGPNRLH